MRGGSGLPLLAAPLNIRSFNSAKPKSGEAHSLGHFSLAGITRTRRLGPHADFNQAKKLVDRLINMRSGRRVNRSRPGTIKSGNTSYIRFGSRAAQLDHHTENCRVRFWFCDGRSQHWKHPVWLKKPMSPRQWRANFF
jgi:hypothetical protein